MNVDAGVLGGLLVQQREGQRHRILRSVFAPDAGTEATMALDQNEILLPVAGRRWAELADQGLKLLALEVALLVDELAACPGARHRNRDSVGAVAQLNERQIVCS